MIQGSTARGDVLSRRWTCECHGIITWRISIPDEWYHWKLPWSTLWSILREHTDDGRQGASEQINSHRVAPGHLTFSSTDTDNNFDYWEPYFFCYFLNFFSATGMWHNIFCYAHCSIPCFILVWSMYGCTVLIVVLLLILVVFYYFSSVTGVNSRSDFDIPGSFWPKLVHFVQIIVF